MARRNESVVFGYEKISENFYDVFLKSDLTYLGNVFRTQTNGWSNDKSPAVYYTREEAAKSLLRKKENQDASTI